MRIDYISDLHTDFWIKEVDTNRLKFQKQLNNFINILSPKEGDVLILAGDQGHYNAQDKEVLLKLKSYYKNILIVPGNHDMYLLSSSTKKRFRKDSITRLNDMKVFCEEQDGLYYMDGQVITINGTTFSGLGMWHDWSYGINNDYGDEKMLRELWNNMMNDSNHIYNKGRKFDPYEYFLSMREKLSKIPHVDVMISHYGPVVPPNIEDYFKDVMSTFYYFDGLEELRRITPSLWIHGHVHSTYDNKISNTRVVTNPLGYPSENTYNSIKSINIREK